MECDISRVFEIHKKANKVISSCQNEIHLKGAYKYCENVKNYMSFINTQTIEETELINSILFNIEKSLNVKKATIK